MKSSSGKNTTSRLSPGKLVFGSDREEAGDPPVLARVFKCRKNGFDYLGQVRIPAEGTELGLEVFNETFYDQFAVSREEVDTLLKSTLLSQLCRDANLPGRYRGTVRSLLDQRVGHDLPPEKSSGPGGDPDLREILERLNREYFGGKIQAYINWGRESRTRNHCSIRFGSYDESKKTIRIHPRLRQSFVPPAVLELTVYHEMCHQWVRPVRKNGFWLFHHPEFKKKEREYRFYREARLWERQHWKKLLAPPDQDAPSERSRRIP